MSESGKRTVRKFNPGMMQPDDEVVRQFVVRKNELDTLVGILRGNIDSQSCQHALVVGPRGRGKTMLLARIAAEIRTATGLSDALLPVRLMEESYEVSSAGDFWLDVLFHLALEIEEKHPDLSLELKATHSDLATRWPGPEWEDLTCGAVLEAADRLGKKLVVMVENMQDLCQQTDGHFGWKLRKAMQTEPNIMLVCSATSRFEALDDASEPFFDIFRMLNLRPLTVAECAELWKAIASEPVSEREIRPLHILTGGSPRLLTVVADFAGHGSLAHLMDNLASLVDEHTEYFRSQLSALSGHKRRVYIALADLWQPSSASEVAHRARLDIRTVSTMLGRLVADGVVETVSNGTRGRYAVVERLMCIYYGLRRQREGVDVVRHLIEFMRAYYGEEWLAGWLDEVIHDPTQPFSVRAEALRARIGMAVGLRGEDQWEGFLDKPEMLEEIVKVVIDGTTNLQTLDVSVYDRIFELWGIGDKPEIRLTKALLPLMAITGQALRGPSERVLAVCNKTEESLRALGVHDDVEPKLMLACIRAITLFGLADERAAENQVLAMYEAFEPDDEAVVTVLLNQLMSVIPIAAVKASERAQRAIVEILLSDVAKAATLWPLIVALRIRLGDVVREPAEVMEVARDIAMEIGQRERKARGWHSDQPQSPGG